MTIHNKTILHWLPAVLFGLAFSLFLILFIRYQRKPEITGIDRLMAAAGDKLEITGQFFGDDAEGARLYIGSTPLTSTGIVEWSDSRILARVPRNDGAALVKVKTRSGTSRGVILGDASRFPRVDYGPWLPGAPFVEYAEPPSGAPGTFVVLHGNGFGEKRRGGQIWVNHSDVSALLGTEEPDLSEYIEVDSIKLWTDHTVQFWLPQGSSTGNIYLYKDGLFSNPVSVEISNRAGHLEYEDEILWSIRQDVQIDRIAAFPGNSLYMFVPSPQAGTGQGKAVVLEKSGQESPSQLRMDGNLAVYRIEELTPESSSLISRQVVVPVSPVRTEINTSVRPSFDPSCPDIAASLGRDAWIRPDLVSGKSLSLVGGVTGNWRKSRILYNYILKLLSWSDTPFTGDVSEYLSTEAADSEGYSFLFVSLARAAGIPSRPVGGILIDRDFSARTWWWAEIWMEGLGWIPVDPALGDGSGELLPEGSTENPVDYYFGSLEGRHIAFSRGILPEKPLQPNPEFRIPRGKYSLQDVWEEISGNLMSYRSIWSVPRVTASY